MRLVIGGIALGFAAGWFLLETGQGAERPSASPPLPNEETFADALRGLLLRFMPDPLHQASPGWGKTSRVPSSVKWTGKRIKLKPELQYKQKNDGTWRKLRVVGDNLSQTLVLRVHDVRPIDAERFRFNLFVSVPVKVHLHQQNWESGVRLYDGTARARVRLNLWLACEAGTRVEKNKDSVVPDLVIQLKMAKATFRWSEFHMEHVAGLGGDVAALLGDVVEKYITEWRDSLESDFIRKAEAAVLKAGASRELRISLGKWMKK